VAATVVAARIARRTTYGCGVDWRTNSVHRGLLPGEGMLPVLAAGWTSSAPV